MEDTKEQIEHQRKRLDLLMVDRHKIERDIKDVKGFIKLLEGELNAIKFRRADAVRRV